MTGYKLGALVLVCLGLGYAFGVHYAPRTFETVKIDEVVKRNNDVKTIKKEVIVKEPNGKETKTIVTETEDKTTTTKEKETSKAVVSGPIEVDKYQVNVMIGVNRDNFMVPIYGVSVSKKFIGPISLGAWGLTNGTGGLSVGMSF